jgi:hypothetical protein
MTLTRSAGTPAASSRRRWASETQTTWSTLARMRTAIGMSVWATAWNVARTGGGRRGATTRRAKSAVAGTLAPWAWMSVGS